VLAVASHVVFGYVGNTMATFVMQSLGCDVAALNTVQFSNHTGYQQFKGTRATASEITDLFQGLKNSFLDDFDMMLTGYVPGAAALEAVGSIARDLKLKATMKPGSFFWVLDPVMGDNGKLYVPEDVVPAYKTLVHDADLILPNQYEAEWLSGVKIIDMNSLTQAVKVLHSNFRVPHILITSVSLPSPGAEPSLRIIGSTITCANTPRIFEIHIPFLDCFFSGTGDMFAALIVVRLREAVLAVEGLAKRDAWISEDDVVATDLPLARAAEKALASMHEVLSRTKKRRDEEVEGLAGDVKGRQDDGYDENKAIYLKKTRAAEVRLVRNVECLRNPDVKFRAEKVDFESA